MYLPWEWFFRKLKRERELNCSVAHKAKDCRAMALLHTVCLFLSFLYSLTTVGKSNDNGSKLAAPHQTVAGQPRTCTRMQISYEIN